MKIPLRWFEVWPAFLIPGDLREMREVDQPRGGGRDWPDGAGQYFIEGIMEGHEAKHQVD